MRTSLKPVERLSLAFTGLLTAVTLIFLQRIPRGDWLLIRYGMVVIAIVALAAWAGTSRAWRPALYVRDFLPVLIIPVLFDSLGDLIPWIWPRYFDDVLISVDYRIFGVHPTVWMERIIHPLLTTVLQFAYISYYPMAIVLGVALLAKKKQEEFDKAVFGIALCFYLSYMGYILIPAVGPRFTLAYLQTRGLEAGPLTVAIQETLNTLENTKTDAFPSGHTAVALMTLYYAWKSKEKVLAGILAPVVSALVVSTVYLRYHYVIDIIAGIALTGFTLWLAPKASRRLSRTAGQPHEQFHDAS